MILGVTAVPFCADYSSTSFFDARSTSAAVAVMFACGPLLLWLSSRFLEYTMYALLKLRNGSMGVLAAVIVTKAQLSDLGDN